MIITLRILFCLLLMTVPLSAQLLVVQSVDVSRADLGKEESLDGIQAVCQEWRKRLRSDYQLGNSFRQLVIIREICEHRLENPASVEKIEVKVEAKKIEVKKS